MSLAFNRSSHIFGRLKAGVVVASSVLTLFPAISAVGGGKQTGTLTDGRQIVNKCFTNYQQMTSYSGKSNTDSLLLNADGKVLNQIGTTVEMKYRRPNKMRLDFITPMGSRVVWSDSKQLGVYDTSDQKYTMSGTAPNMDSMLPLLFNRAGITAAFDPLYALAHGSLPADMQNVQLKEKINYNGHPVYVVTGQLKSAIVTYWTWWIDRSTLLMYKVQEQSGNENQKVNYLIKGKPVTATRVVKMMVRNVVIVSQPNAQIGDADLAFKPPAGASERITPSAVPKGK